MTIARDDGCERPDAFAVVTDMDGLQRALRQRAEELGIARRILDQVAGLADGHVEKLLTERPLKRIGPVSMFPLIGALGLAVVLVEDPKATKRLAGLPRYLEPRRGPSCTGKAHWRYRARAALLPAAGDPPEAA